MLHYYYNDGMEICFNFEFYNSIFIDTVNVNSNRSRCIEMYKNDLNACKDVFAKHFSYAMCHCIISESLIILHSLHGESLTYSFLHSTKMKKTAKRTGVLNYPVAPLLALHIILNDDG